MKTRLACVALVLMASLAVPAAPQSCPPEDPTVVCGFYCNNYDGQCWGPAQPTSACSAFGGGCVSSDPSPYCSCGGGF